MFGERTSELAEDILGFSDFLGGDGLADLFHRFMVSAKRMPSAALIHSNCSRSGRRPIFSIFLWMRATRFSVQWLASM
jgi:hypothetical protein